MSFLQHGASMKYDDDRYGETYAKGPQLMMTERMRALVERVEQLPPEEQNYIAEEIEETLDNAEWHALLADPRSETVLDTLIAEAKQSPKRPWPMPADMGDPE